MTSRLAHLQRLTELSVQRLVADWSGRDCTSRPWGMWVLLWEAIERDEELDAYLPAVPMTAAWFLTSTGFVRRDTWSYLRYRAVKKAVLERLRTNPWGPKEPHASGIGVLEVAPYRGEAAVYAAAYFGPLNAYGFRMELDARGEPVTRRLWVS